jgi:hypothetical protein
MPEPPPKPDEPLESPVPLPAGLPLLPPSPVLPPVSVEPPLVEPPMGDVSVFVFGMSGADRAPAPAPLMSVVVPGPAVPWLGNWASRAPRTSTFPGAAADGPAAIETAIRSALIIDPSLYNLGSDLAFAKLYWKVMLET